MSTEVATRDEMAGVVEQVVVGGDLSKLSAKDRLIYYQAVCESVGLNPLTRPFSFLTLSGRLVLYANRDATDQLRKINGVSIERLERETVEGLYIVTAYAKDVHGRVDSSIGAVPIENLRGEAKANSVMKCETKAKRRVTLSICGLGMLDETETGSIPDAKDARIDYDTGEIIEPPKGPATYPEFKPAEKPIAPEQPTLEEDAQLSEQMERSILLAQCKAAADKAKLSAGQRADILIKYEIRDPREAALPALADMLAHLRTLAPAK